ncbi:phosphate transporter [Pavlovales sp. CCMP2436]|nr:phosphate transporter [Pavlovales sp. CCMP2436]
MVIAAIFEFLGAVLLGSQVSETIRRGISNPKCFADMPAVLMWGMCSVCLAVGIWLLVATSLELPVSTTHSAVGGVIGMSLVAVGSKCVMWNAPSDEFPFVKGVAAIVLSWVFSPVLSGILSAGIYYLTRTFVMRAPNSTERALLTYPLLIAFCIAMIVAYVVAKGTKSVNDLWGFDAEGEDLWLLAVFSVGAGLVAAGLSLFLKPIIRRAVEETSDDPADASKAVFQTDGVLAWIQRKLDTDLDALVAEDLRSANIHSLAEKFKPKTETVFKFMQIMTASFDAFAHGANDVANAMGPFTAVWFIYSNDGKYSAKNQIGLDIYWILALGGASIVLGLGTYGYKIMFALGLKLAKVTPSRGFGIELGSMFVILLGSRFGIPLSTTHCQVGSTIGVSLMEGRASSTNWTIVGKCVIGWIMTMIIAGGLTAAIFSIGYATISFDSSQKLSPGWQGF